MSFFDAGFLAQYNGTNITCDNNLACTIICDETGLCQNLTITCPQNYACSVTCSAQLSCAYATIIPPSDQSLFNFPLDGSSYSLIGLRYPIYPVDDYADATLSCSTSAKCAGLIYTCPAYARCNITCKGSHSCRRVCSVH